MNGQTCTEIAGIACITALGITAMVIDGDMGESMVAAVSAALGGFVMHVYHTSKEEVEDEEEV